MNIKREQILKINSRCKNNWQLDVPFLLFYSEKTFIKNINLDNKCYLQFTLKYNERNQIMLHISKYTKVDDKNAMSNGLGKFKILNDISETRKTTSKLIDYTAELTDEKLLEINKSTPVAKATGLILESEDF